MENIKTLIQENKDCKMEKGVLCAQHCRDSRYMEMENDHYNDGNRRCAYKGCWLPPSTEACAAFQW